MTELRIADGFARFDEPIEPATAFADALYATLVGQLGLATAHAEAGSTARRGGGDVADRVPGAIHAIRWPASARWRLVARLAVVAALLAALLGALMLAGSILIRPRTAAELVARSQAAYRAAPALTLTARGPDLVEFMMRTDGRGTWRIERRDEPGTFALYDGVRSGRYDADQKTWGSGPESERGGPPFPFNAEFTWTIGEYTDAMARRTMPCTGAVDLGVSTLIARPVDHVRCPDADIEYWLDQETGLVLRMQAGPTAAHWDAGSVMEVLTIRMGLDDPAAFSWSGPPGAFDENAPPPSTALVVGEVAPAWTGTTIDGTPIDTRRLARPTALLFCARSSCARVVPAFRAAALSRDDVDAIVVELEYLGTIAGSLAAHPIDLPVIADEPPDYPFLAAWSLGFPTAVLLATDGRVLGLLPGGYPIGEWQRAFAAIAAGDEIPALEPVPDPTPWPMPSVFEFGELSILSRGTVLDAWAAPLLDGGRFDSTSLLGRPSIVWFWGGWDCEACFPGQLEAFQAVVGPLAGRIGAVVVAAGEKRPGDVRRLVEAAGVDRPVVFDWDGSVDTIFRLAIVGSAFILDAGGRLVDVVEGPPTAADLAALFPTLAAGSAPP